MSNRKYYTIVFLVLLYCAYNYWDRLYGFHICPLPYYDFRCYAGLDPSRQLYKDFLMPLFAGYKQMPFQLAFLHFYIVSSIFTAFAITKIMELPYGEILSLGYLKIVGWTLIIGNVDPILAAACLTAVGTLPSILFKPYLFVFSLIHSYGSRGTGNDGRKILGDNQRNENSVPVFGTVREHRSKRLDVYRKERGIAVGGKKEL